ncbi:MAG: ribosome hibernation-promoting factor, HPF/YfiA family [Chthoniobacteraceae bacterium]
MQVANVNLPIKVTGRHVAVTESLKDYAIKKVEGLHLDTPRIIEAQVILDVQKYRQIAEVILHCANHITIEATAQSNDLYAAIDEVMGKIAQQMRKFKTRIMRQSRPKHAQIKTFNEKIIEVASSTEEHPIEVEPKVIETEQYQVKPMFVDEAILQLEVSDREFLVFTNAKTEKVNVLHRRKEGGFGLIEPIA